MEMKRADSKFPRFNFADKMKRGQVTIWIIVAIFLVGAVIVTVMFWGMWEPEERIIECNLETWDCLPDTCYDPNECVPRDLAPNPSVCAATIHTEICLEKIPVEIGTALGDLIPGPLLEIVNAGGKTYDITSKKDVQGEGIGKSYNPKDCLNRRIDDCNNDNCFIDSERVLECGDNLECIEESVSEGDLTCINNCIDSSIALCGFPNLESLPDCADVIYEPDCTRKINLQPRCEGANGKCVCDRDGGRNVCKVEMS